MSDAMPENSIDVKWSYGEAYSAPDLHHKLEVLKAVNDVSDR